MDANLDLEGENYTQKGKMLCSNNTKTELLALESRPISTSEAVAKKVSNFSS